VPPEVKAGSVALISQSGSVATNLMHSAGRFGLSIVASTGNEAVTTAEDLMEYAIDDPNTRIIVAFIEALRRPEKLFEIADRAHRAGKPIVVTYEAKPSPERNKHATAAHGAQFVEVKIDASTGEIRVTLETGGSQLEIDIQDNGIGLPDQPSRLFEPYVTHRAKGTGLGLPIVKKIIEEHDGTLELIPAPVFEGSAGPGAWARILLPQALPEQHWEGDEKSKITEKLRESMR